MKMILKSALAVAAMAGAAAMIPTTASAAGISVGIAVPAPIIVVAPNDPGYSPYDEQYYYDPIFISGSWYHGPYRWKMRNGQRVFLVNGRWHRNEWRDNSYPATITFRNGGHYNGGRYHGFRDADRINARFRADRQEDRREHRQEERREDRQDARHDGGDGPTH